MALTVAEIDDAIDALVVGGMESYTTPSGLTVTKTKIKDLIELRKSRKAQEDDSEGGVVPQYVEFGAGA